MNRVLAIALISIGFCGFAAAQQSAGDAPATKEDVQRYLEVMHSKDMVIKTMDAMAKPMHQMIHEQYVKDEDKLPADFEDRMNRMMDEEMKTFPWNELLDAMVPVYQKHFTKNDVDALVGFYSTPTGQKVIAEMPQITAESTQNMMPLLQKKVDSMMQRMQEEVAAMSKEPTGKQ